MNNVNVSQCVFFYNRVCICTQSLFVTPWTVAHQPPLSIEFLEWVAISNSRVSSQPGDRTRVSCVYCVGRRIRYHGTTKQCYL